VIVGVQASRDGGRGEAQPGVERGAALGGRDRGELASEDGIGRRRRVEASEQRPDVEAGAPDDDGQPAALADRGDRRRGVAAEPRSLVAVSVFTAQIGSRMRVTSSVLTEATGTSPMCSHARSKVARHWYRCFALRHAASWAAR